MTAVAADGSGLSTSRPLELRKRCLIWLASRLTVAAIVVTGALLRDVDAQLRQAEPWTWLLYRFAAWDSHLYAAIAARGYVADGSASHYNAFFPGLPGVMRLWTSLTGTDGRWGGLIVVELAGRWPACCSAGWWRSRVAEPRRGRWPCCCCPSRR